MTDARAETLRRLAGTWRLLSSEFRTSRGQVIYPLGEDALGQVILSESGHMSAQLLRAGRPNFGADSQFGGTPDEVMSAFMSYAAYYGRVELDLEQGRLITHVEGSLFPNWVGGEQVRFFVIDGDRLTLTTPPFPLGEEECVGVLSWQRE